MAVIGAHCIVREACLPFKVQVTHKISEIGYM